MHLLSPAARKLISSQIRPGMVKNKEQKQAVLTKLILGSNDRSLKASYTPKRTGSLTPLAKTPKLHRTPKVLAVSFLNLLEKFNVYILQSTPTPNPTTSSITDDLLNISNIKTKRKKASDFFT